MAEIFDEEFNNYLEIAKGFVERISHKKDREVCIKWIKRMCDLDSQNVNVKKHRNNFCKYFLKVMQQQLGNQGCGPGHELECEIKAPGNKPAPVVRRWSDDQSTYISLQPIDGGILLYMAVAKKPELGWERWDQKDI